MRGVGCRHNETFAKCTRIPWWSLAVICLGLSPTWQGSPDVLAKNLTIGHETHPFQVVEFVGHSERQRVERWPAHSMALSRLGNAPRKGFSDMGLHRPASTPPVRYPARTRQFSVAVVRFRSGSGIFW